MNYLLLESDNAGLILYFIIGFISFLLGVWITRLIFSVDKFLEYQKTQAVLLSKQLDTMEQHSTIMIAQLELIASIADKAGIPVKDINDVTKDFGIEFE
jgi:hypothetical protein